MFTVNAMPAQLPPDAIDLLIAVDPVKIGHYKTDGIMDHTMTALFPRRYAVGTAVTVNAPGADGTIIPLAMGMLRRGDFLVIARGGDMKHAAWGGGLAYAAALIGVAGIAIDGLICDINALRDHGVPTWHRGTSALTTQRLGQAGQINTPVSCGGITVNPGDAVAADENGVVVLNPAEIADLAAKAAAAKAGEPRTRRRLDAGEKLSDIRGTLEFIRSRGFRLDMP
jgi:4-hydroxy-4-methyl-2-oxoglutarate aldolase